MPRAPRRRRKINLEHRYVDVLIQGGLDELIYLYRDPLGVSLKARRIMGETAWEDGRYRSALLHSSRTVLAMLSTAAEHYRAEYPDWRFDIDSVLDEQNPDRDVRYPGGTDGTAALLRRIEQGRADILRWFEENGFWAQLYLLSVSLYAQGHSAAALSLWQLMAPPDPLGGDPQPLSAAGTWGILASAQPRRALYQPGLPAAVITLVRTAMDRIIIKGAREHNLRGIDLELPRDKLIVISGLSGSGKSSLAFDTIFAEGQRRYVESLSAYARQFLGRMDKPDVDYLEGLSPAISIEQKTTSRNPRSTVGTITEIYDYLRLLFARIGRPVCPNDGTPIREQSVDQILDSVLSLPEGRRLMILAPLIRGKKGEHKKIFDDARRAGFVRVRVDGEVLALEDEIRLEKNRKHDVSVVVDRLKVDSENRKRLSESVETALEVAEGQVKILMLGEGEDQKELFFSERNSCPKCGFSLPELQPRLFSFNSPFGACAACDGLGMTQEFDRDLIMPNPSLSFNERRPGPLQSRIRLAPQLFRGPLGGHGIQP